MNLVFSQCHSNRVNTATSSHGPQAVDLALEDSTVLDGDGSPSLNEETGEELADVPQLALDSAKRSLLSVAFGPSLGLLVCWIFIAIMHTLLLSPAGGIGKSIPIGMELWFTTHMLPLTINNITISFLPILPAIILICVVKWFSTRAANDPSAYGDPRLVVLTAVIGALIIGGLNYILLNYVDNGFPLELSSVWQTVLYIILIHGGGSCWGVMRSQRGAILLIPEKLYPLIYSRPFNIAMYYVGRLFRWSSLTLMVYMAVRIYYMGGQWLNIAGAKLTNAIPLSILSIGYIPNFAILTLRFILGDILHIGQGVCSIFSLTVDDNLPLLPAWVLLPQSKVYSWWMWLPFIAVVVLLPIAVCIARYTENAGQVLLSSLYTAVLCTVIITGLSFFSSGIIGILGSVEGSLLYIFLVTLVGVFVIICFFALLYQQFVEGVQLIQFRREATLLSQVPEPEVDIISMGDSAELYDYESHNYDHFDQLGSDSQQMILAEINSTMNYTMNQQSNHNDISLAQGYLAEYYDDSCYTRENLPKSEDDFVRTAITENLVTNDDPHGTISHIIPTFSMENRDEITVQGSERIIGKPKFFRRKNKK